MYLCIHIPRVSTSGNLIHTRTKSSRWCNQTMFVCSSRHPRAKAATLGTAADSSMFSDVQRDLLVAACRW